MSSEFASNRTWTCRIGTLKGTRIPLKLMEGYPTINSSTGDTGITIVEKFLLESRYVPTFLSEAHGSETVMANKTLAFTYPMSFPGFSRARCTNVSLEPYPPSKPGDPFNSMVSWDASDTGLRDTYTHMYAATVTYQLAQVSGGGQDLTPDEDVDEDDPVDNQAVHTMSGGAFIQTHLAEMGYHIIGSPTDFFMIALSHTNATVGTIISDLPANHVVDEIKNLGTPIGQVIPTVEHSIRYPAKRYPNFADMVSQLGRVNDAQRVHRLDGENCNYERFKTAYLYPGTILYVGFTATPKFSIDMAPGSSEYGKVITKYEIDLRFSERFGEGGLIGWNQVWSDHGQTWIMPVFPDPDQDDKPRIPLYRYGDFSLLSQSVVPT